MSDKDLTQPPAGEFIMFASGDGRVRVECRFESDTIWLSQAAMAERSEERRVGKECRL